ncbi:ArsR family transcriptional regulator [Halobacteriales archaeon QS_8_69_26]|nr:MAG: ArsR family transcriptional regulator [Halobacteriales archaeon QS_8_69_26]
MFDDADGDDVVERISPERAFELLGHETRLRILAELDDADDRVQFGDLRDRVGADDPGRFNYHLQELTDRFVRRSDEGYRIAPAGRRVVGAVRSGTLTKEMAAEPTAVDGSCTICDADLVAEFDGDTVRIRCVDCEWILTEPAVPPSVLEDWSIPAVPAATGRWLRRLGVSAKLGLCPNCDGRLDVGLYRPGDPGSPDWFSGTLSPAVRVATCRRCGHWWHTLAEIAVVTEPAVVAFHYEHGIDVFERPNWELDWVELDLASVESEDPLRVSIPITLDGETRTFVVDRDVSVVEVRDDPRP